MSTFASSCVATVCLALLMLAGCGGVADQPELGTVTGRITYDGNPLANYIVNFQPSNGRPSVGATDANGRYELDYTLAVKGAKVGTHKVFLVFDSNSAASDMVSPGEMSPVQTVSNSGVPPEGREILKINGSAQTTLLTAEVKGGANVLDFELKTP